MLGFLLPIMLCGISYRYISDNIKEYNAYAKSEDIINVEATVSKVYKSDIKQSKGKNRGFDIVETEYDYTMIYTVNDNEYKDTLVEKSSINNFDDNLLKLFIDDWKYQTGQARRNNALRLKTKNDEETICLR